MATTVPKPFLIAHQAKVIGDFIISSSSIFAKMEGMVGDMVDVPEGIGVEAGWVVIFHFFR